MASVATRALLGIYALGTRMRRMGRILRIPIWNLVPCAMERSLKHVYAIALERELLSRGHSVSREFGVMIIYKGDELTFQRLDMVVDEKLVIEIKSTFRLDPSASTGVLEYDHQGTTILRSDIEALIRRISPVRLIRVHTAESFRCLADVVIALVARSRDPLRLLDVPAASSRQG